MVLASQSTGLIAAMILFIFYPITRKRAEETRRLLEERKAAAGVTTDD
jgi:Na+/melibiose symporter-like transporter